MKHSARCSMPPLAVLALAMISLSGCAGAGSEAALGACPPAAEYSRAEQAQAAAEVEAMPEGAVIERMLSDYAVMREQARACR